MKKRPILFSTPMVQAILEGRKTVTRRIVKPEPGYQAGWLTHEFLNSGIVEGFGQVEGQTGVQLIHSKGGPLTWIKCPYGNIGDVLWVRENVWEHGQYVRTPIGETGDSEQKWNSFGRYSYAATDNRPELYRSRPSIYMPYNASRLFLKITDIRVERLHDITEEQAKAEGLNCLSKDGSRTFKYGIADKDGMPGNDDTGWHWHDWDTSPVNAFAKLWKTINGQGSWQSNPFVWAVSFERTEKPE